MKKKAFSKFFSILLTVLVLASMPTQALAASSGELSPSAAPMHTHTYVFDKYSYSYMELDSATHVKVTMAVYRCTGCGNLDGIIVSSATVAHVFTTSLTGNNNHNGTRHFDEYKKICEPCGYTNVYWQSRPCSGPPCTILTLVPLDIS